MRKILPFILLFATLLSLFAVPANAAETLTDLQKVHTNLTTYLYTPFYQDSKYFEEYQEVMNEVGELLASDDITQAEISKYYNEVRRVYAQLMQDTYDYSSLQILLDSYNALDASIFTEESWKKIVSIRDSAKKELDSPSLFSRSENMPEKEYTAYINSHIRKFTSDFNDAFNRLLFVSRPEAMTSDYLSAFIKLVRFCAREELLGEAQGWAALQQALENAETTASLNKPKDGVLDQAFDDILNSYFNVCNVAYDFSDSKEALSKYHVMTAKSFSKDSWERYSDAATALEKRLTQPHFFFIPLGASKETCEKYAKNYLSSLPSLVNETQDTLITVESLNKLQNLCDKYRNKTSMDGLDIKLNFLKTRVSEGEVILSNKEATNKDIEEAIKNIETAHNDLVTAEGHLIEEQSKIVKQDSKTSRFTIIFYIASMILAAGFAVILSRFFFGKVNWSK